MCQAVTKTEYTRQGQTFELKQNYGMQNQKMNTKAWNHIRLKAGVSLHNELDGHL